MKKYYDPMKDNFGYDVEDVFPLLPWSREHNNKTFYYKTEGEFDAIRIEKDFTGTFMAPNYMHTKLLGFRYLFRITTKITKTGVTTERKVFIDFL